MKKISTLLVMLMLVMTGIAQTKANDSIPKKQRDSVFKIGGITIKIKKSEKGKAREVEIESNEGDSVDVNTNDKVNVNVSSERKYRKVKTDWIGFDFGFNGFTDNSTYGATNTYTRAIGTQTRPDANSFKLKSGKSLGVNFWLVKQKVNIAKNYLGVKYAIGIEHLNYRFNSNISFVNNAAPYVFNDSVSFSKNKLGINYLTVPLMLYINPDGKERFSFSAGVSAGYKLNSFSKQRSDRGKVKNRGEFDINPFKLALVGDIGYKRMRVFGSYGLTNLFDNSSMEATPFTVGIRWSRW